MTKKEKCEYIVTELERLYPETPIPLDHTDAYTLLIAVLLSAQCTDKRVNLITPILFKRANNPFDMIKLSVEEIREIIRPCGLSPRKSQAIFTLSEMLIEKYGGEVPQSFEALEELPGVGHKTAGLAGKFIRNHNKSRRNSQRKINLKIIRQTIENRYNC